MLRVALESIPILVGAITWWLLWRALFKHLPTLRGQLTLDIREQVIPDIDRANNALTTLASAAIVLTFTALQIWSTKTTVHQHYLVLSWLGFAVTVLIGAIQRITLYIYRTVNIVMISRLERDLKNNAEKKLEGNSVEALRSSMEGTKSLERLLFVLMFVQPLLFTVAMVYLLMFAIANL